MKIAILNGKRMTSEKTAHSYLKRKLSLPDYYGNNLDALWDELTVLSDPIEIVLINSDTLYENTVDYGRSIVSVFVEASEENENIEFKII